jgi:hypothetical protein
MCAEYVTTHVFSRKVREGIEGLVCSFRYMHGPFFFLLFFFFLLCRFCLGLVRVSSTMSTYAFFLSFISFLSSPCAHDNAYFGTGHREREILPCYHGVMSSSHRMGTRLQWRIVVLGDMRYGKRIRLSTNHPLPGIQASTLRDFPSKRRIVP